MDSASPMDDAPRGESAASLHMRVMSEPENESVREAFADAIEPIDPDWATLIRVQLTMARMSKARVDSYPLSLQAGPLVREHGKRWAGRIDQAVSGWSFYRGFVELIEVDAEWFLETADELYAMAPVLHLNLTDAALVTEELFNSPHLARITSISLLRNNFGDDEVAVLAASPYLGNLEWLSLSNNQIGADGIEALAASTCLPRLGYLDFAFNPLPDPTPQHADEYDGTSPAAQALQDKYGRREWLDAYARFAWPPPRDAVWPVTT